MANGGEGYFSRLIRDRIQSRWEGASARADALPMGELRRNASDARRLRRALDSFLTVAHRRLLGSRAEPALADVPLGTDTIWRPDIWAAPVSPTGAVASDNATALSSGVTLFHDCPLRELIIRQVPAMADHAHAPYAVRVEVMGFAGTFLSLAIALPPQMIEGLRRDHVVRVMVGVEAERPIQLYARLNVRHGPNVTEVLRALPDPQGGYAVADFDMHDSDLNEKRVESGWLDVIFEKPQMNAVTLTDIVVLRHPRADL